MAILEDFGVAAPHQNYDVTSRASNDAGFFKNFSTRVFSPNCTILPSCSKIGVGRVFLVHPYAVPCHLLKNCRKLDFSQIAIFFQNLKLSNG